jgi:predicted ATP-dependent endonuclease of OLD family
LKEKLIIKNFGPIKYVELELGRFNVLIGEQATGKSTVAKVLAVCRYFSYIVQDNQYDQPFESGLISWGLNEAIHENTYIYYDCQHYSFVVERKMTIEHGYDQEDHSPIEYDLPIFISELIPKSKEFSNLLDELKKIRPTSFEILSAPTINEWTPPTSFFQNDVAKVMDNPFFLPTERGLQSVFSLGKNSIENISDSLFNQLAGLDRIARLFKTETAIEPLDILYKNEKGRGYVRKKGENQFFSLFNAASGYQSTIPAVLVIQYYSEIRKKRKTFIAEEPELNLFPSAQQKLMQYMVDKVMNYGNTILLTTQSPYSLTSLNNMMYAYQVGISKPFETEEIIEKKYWLNPEDVSAYMLSTQGTAISILDRDINQIEAGAIDAVSRQINKEWDDLLKIEVNGK